jgi:hypothetical protein
LLRGKSSLEGCAMFRPWALIFLLQGTLSALVQYLIKLEEGSWTD